jgi:hypothetical protein
MGGSGEALLREFEAKKIRLNHISFHTLQLRWNLAVKTRRGTLICKRELEKAT